mgnify:CR=1 FL=1
MKPTTDQRKLQPARRRLRAELADGEWHLRKNIDMENRMIRHLCQVFPGDFISSQRGYKLLEKATDAEIDEAVADLQSRMGHMRARIAGMTQAQYNRRYQ